MSDRGELLIEWEGDVGVGGQGLSAGQKFVPKNTPEREPQRDGECVGVKGGETGNKGSAVVERCDGLRGEFAREDSGFLIDPARTDKAEDYRGADQRRNA